MRQSPECRPETFFRTTRGAAGVARIHVDARREQRPAGRRVALTRRLVEGRLVTSIPRVQRRRVLAQELGQLPSRGGGEGRLCHWEDDGKVFGWSKFRKAHENTIFRLAIPKLFG